MEPWATGSETLSAQRCRSRRLGFMKRPGYLMLGILSWRGFHSGELDRVINAGLYAGLLLISALLGVLLFRALVRGSPSSNHPLPVIASSTPWCHCTTRCRFTCFIPSD